MKIVSKIMTNGIVFGVFGFFFVMADKHSTDIVFVELIQRVTDNTYTSNDVLIVGFFVALSTLCIELISNKIGGSK